MREVELKSEINVRLLTFVGRAMKTSPGSHQQDQLRRELPAKPRINDNLLGYLLGFRTFPVRMHFPHEFESPVVYFRGDAPETAVATIPDK